MDIEKLVDQYEKPDFDDCGASKYVLRSDGSEESLKSFDHEIAILMAQCSNGISSVVEPAEMQKLDSLDHQKFLQQVKSDLKAKLKDVRATNNVAQGVPAFISIFALLGFLSKCAFAYNSTAVKANKKVETSDEVRFIAFVNRFLLNTQDRGYLTAKKKKGLARVLYKMARCGLIHGETLLHSDKEFNGIKLGISHNHLANESLIDLDKRICSGEKDIVLNAWVLCEAIGKAIDNIFADNDSSVIDSIVEVYKHEPPILLWKPQPQPNASYTLYSVLHETRESREQRIRDVFAMEPAWGYLMAVFDFEWTIRRAIVLMNPCPTALINKHLSDKKYSGWKGYCDCWRICVQKIRNDGTPSLGRLVFDGPAGTDITEKESALIEEGMQLRHRLVHGIKGSIPVGDADSCFEWLLTASEKIFAYVDEHAEKKMHDRVTRKVNRCTDCPSFRRCHFQKDRDALRKNAKISKREKKLT